MRIRTPRNPPYREDTIFLSDGRELGVAEFGVPDGQAILWFHGTPGARRQVPPAARAAAKARGLRIIGVERPGIGDSTPHLYDSFRDWADDIEEVVDQLGIDRFGVIGLSGGGPYVLACAHAMPHRVVAGVVLGGVAPACGDEAAAGGPVALARMFEPILRIVKDPMGYVFSFVIVSLHPLANPIFDAVVGLMGERDQEIMQQPETRAMFIDDLLRATAAGGLRSIVYDGILFARPWGFSLGEIKVPIHFFQGDADPLVPFSHGAHQAMLIPGATLTRRHGEGHLGGLALAKDAIAFIMRHWPAKGLTRKAHRGSTSPS